MTVAQRGTVPKEFIPAVEKGLRNEKEGGLLIGFPVIDFKARLVDGKVMHHEVDSERAHLRNRGACLLSAKSPTAAR